MKKLCHYISEYMGVLVLLSAIICGYLPEMVDTHFSFNTIKL